MVTVNVDLELVYDDPLCDLCFSFVLNNKSLNKQASTFHTVTKHEHFCLTIIHSSYDMYEPHELPLRQLIP